MKFTTHTFLNENSQNTSLEDNSINLIVTSPPYPMIKMWDEIMLKKESTNLALDSDFKKMTSILDKIWKEMYRVLKPGGLMAINMGDATRSNKIGFKIYPNSSMVIQSCLEKGFEELPGIIWSKPTNSPNKFLGSGMYPVLSYVTLEHENILIFRKGKNRSFNKEEMQIRKESAFFWEERNEWFSDIWTIRGTKQKVKGLSRERNGAYPIDIPYRLIAMFSIKGDTILDPFLGTGTTSVAAASLERNSIGIDLMNDFIKVSKGRLLDSKDFMNDFNNKRIEKHRDFSKKLIPKKDYIKNEFLSLYVKTKWEKEINFKEITFIKEDKSSIRVDYGNFIKNKKN